MKLSDLMRRVATCAVVFASLVLTVSAATFVPLKEAECLNGAYFAGYTVGGQYVDPNNGVLQDQYSMLVRWQGNDMVTYSVSYDMGHLTGFHTGYQRGRQPEDYNGSPGVQVNCQDEGILINTWDTPHRPIVGGGYNDMWGYAWSSVHQPHPFVDSLGQPAELVLQSNLGIATYLPWPKAGSDVNNIHVDVTFFAYVQDTTHPNKHPIAIIGRLGASDADSTCPIPSSLPCYYRDGFLGFDYNDAATQLAVTSYPAWFAPGQTGNGVWFGSGPISTASTNTNPYVTTRYTQGTDSLIVSGSNSNPPMLFYRAHVTQANLIAIINGINSNPCSGPPNCPAKPAGGYSTNPANYVLKYAGVIAEVALKNDHIDSGNYDASPSSWLPNDTNKDQGAFGGHINGFSVYQYLP